MSTELDTRTDHPRELTLAPSESTDSLTGLSTIEGIDLDADVVCEDWEHEDDSHPADLIVRFHCCSSAPTLALCYDAWRSFGVGVLCTKTGITYPRDVVATVLDRLR